MIWNKNLQCSLKRTTLSLKGQILVAGCGCNVEICIRRALETFFVKNVGIFDFILIFGEGEMMGNRVYINQNKISISFSDL